MGCGQSKINLYPRRNKSCGKGHGLKKSAGGDSKDADEEETTGNAASGSESPREGAHSGAAGGGHTNKPRPPPAPPHVLGHAATTEISASQIDFFKMLDEKIEQGRDYDSSSETEILIEQARVASLLQSWETASHSSQCFTNASSPPTPRSNRRPGRGGTPASPPVRRGYIDCNSSLEKDSHKTGSPAKRAVQVPNWKVSSKSPVAPLQLKPSQKLDGSDDQRSYSPQLLTQREIHQSYGVSQDYVEISRDSQITYNPTFQSHSPIHVAKNTGQSVPQPYIAQIITYPMSQQAVSYQSMAQKYSSPTTTYQPAAPLAQQQPPPPVAPQQPAPVAPTIAPGTQPQPQQRLPGRIQPGQQQPTNIFYIAPTSMVQPQIPQDQVLTTKQQTALHLQQYVAMKQAQQALGYQRMMAGQDYSLYTQGDSPGAYARKLYDRSDENYSLNFMTLGRQPPSQKAVVQAQVVKPLSPGLMQFQQSQVTVGQTLTQQSQFQRSQMNPNMFQNTPGCTASLGRNQSLTYHKDLVNERFSANLQFPPTAGQQSSTNPNMARSNMCQSISIVTQKTVGQIAAGANQDLVIYQNLNDAGSGSGSDTVSRTSSNNSVINATELSTFKDVTKTAASASDTSEITKNISKANIGSSIVGRQVYYSQVVSSGLPIGGHGDTPQSNTSLPKVTNSDSFIMNDASDMRKNTIDVTTSKNSVRTIVQKTNSLDKNGGDYL